MRPSFSQAVAVLTLGAALLVTGCHKRRTRAYAPPPPPYARERSPQSAERQPVAPPSMRGRPDVVEEGVASWYGPPYNHRHAADGTVYDQNAMTAAHRTLPFGTLVRVTNLSNGESAIVRITDRGPFVPGRIIDLSLAAARATGIYRSGIARVRVEAYLPKPAAGADPDGRWCVQIGAFLQSDDALQLKNDLMRRYQSARVIEFQGPTGYWVRINPRWPDKKAATEIASSIHVPDVEPYLVRLD